VTNLTLNLGLQEDEAAYKFFRRPNYVYCTCVQQGDSGGPVFCLRPGGQQYELIGVVSWGYGDCPALPAFPSINTFVPAFLPWINASMVAVGE